jgi:hypothetical protein
MLHTSRGLSSDPILRRGPVALPRPSRSSQPISQPQPLVMCFDSACTGLFETEVGAAERRLCAAIESIRLARRAGPDSATLFLTLCRPASVPLLRSKRKFIPAMHWHAPGISRVVPIRAMPAVQWVRLYASQAHARCALRRTLLTY